MATSPAQIPKTPESKPSLSDVNARDHFIAVALREIIASQIAEKKWNHEMAAVLAVRYANAVMSARPNTEVLNVVMAKGAVTVAQEKFEKVVESIVETPPKSIAEIIGEAEPVAEVK